MTAPRKGSQLVIFDAPTLLEALEAIYGYLPSLPRQPLTHAERTRDERLEAKAEDRAAEHREWPR